MKKRTTKPTERVSVYGARKVEILPGETAGEVDVLFDIPTDDKACCWDLLRPAVIVMLQDDKECREIGLENCYGYIRDLLGREHSDLPQLVARWLAQRVTK